LADQNSPKAATTAQRRGRPFTKGVSGNPAGRPRGVVGPTGEVRSLALQSSPAAIARLTWLAEHGKPDAVQVSACAALLANGLGRPVPAFQAEGMGALIVNIVRSNPQPAGPTQARGDRPMALPAPVPALGDGGEVLRDERLRRLPEDERHVVEVLVRAYPAAVALDVLSEATGFPPAVLDRHLNWLKCFHFVVSEGGGAVRAASQLFQDDA
jgi:hypothetical protein